jgi:hypothetical protein
MWCRTILFAGLSIAVSADEEPFLFVVMSDIHGFTPLSFKPFDNSTKIWREGERILKNIKNNYGVGEFVVMPGDSASYGGMSNAKIASKLGGNLPHYDAIYQAGVNCHSGTKALFNSAGFDALLPTVGDHELGGNKGFQVAKKLSQTTDSSLPTNTVSELPSNLSSSPTQSPVFTCDGKNCTDDETFEFTLNNGNVRKCAWIGKRNTAKRSSKYCVYEEIKSACKESCGVIDSCQDDSDFTFSLRNGNTQNCFWFNKNEKKATARKYRYCYEDDRSTPTVLAGSCARSCGLCAAD